MNKKSKEHAAHQQENPHKASSSMGKVTSEGKSRIKIKYDVGFNNALYIRGAGGKLSWDKGQKLQNVGKDEWVWEIDLPSEGCEFKVLINDQKFEVGENHHLAGGTVVQYTPRF